MSESSTSRALHSHSLLSEASMIAAVPALAYTYAFVYEAGWARPFKIPLSFITITPTGVFVAAGALLATFVALLFVADIVSSLAPKKNPALARSFRVLLPILILTLAFALSRLGTPQAPLIWGLTLPWAIVLFLEYLHPLISQRGKGTYLEKLEAQARHDAELSGILRPLAAKLGSTYLLGFYVALFLAVTYYLGEGQAMRQQAYLVSNGDPPLVVLRIYGQDAVLAPLNVSTRTIQSQFTIAPLSTDSLQPFTLEEVGPLQLAAPPS